MAPKRMERFGSNGWRSVNRRAARALDAVLASFRRVMGDGASAVKAVEAQGALSPFCQDAAISSALGAGCLARVRLERGDGALGCYMGYVPHNKALSSLYDFTVWLPFDGRSEHTSESGKGHGFVQRIEDENALVASRAESLGLMNSRVVAGDDCYLVEVRFMVGSFTWTAVPTVANTIAFSEQDCVRLVELLFMISLSVR